MKKIRAILSVILVIAICAAWVAQITSGGASESEYDKYLDSAENYMARSLYQKAADSYKSALLLKEDKEIRDKWIQANHMAYDDEVISKNSFASALSEACGIYPEEAPYWETLLELYIQNSDYASAHSSYNKSVRAGAESEKLTELGLEIEYSFTSSSRTYKEVYESPDGYYTLYSDPHWGVMEPDSEWLYECEYQYISPVSDDRIALCTSEKGQRVISDSGVVQAIVTEPVLSARAVFEGILPVRGEDGMWRYLDCNENKYLSGEYDDASSYVNGISAVRKGSGWSLINTDGDKITETGFEDIKLYGNGDYVYKDRMIASVGGRYGLYDGKGEEVTALNAVDADIYLDDYIAYQDESGKWGFMDSEGKVVIEPQYEGARSFSNGLAAVLADGYWGYINHDRQMAIENQFLDAGYFTKDGVAFVSTFEGFYYMIKLRF